jgi:hypothetical protein
MEKNDVILDDTDNTFDAFKKRLGIKPVKLIKATDEDIQPGASPENDGNSGK